MSSTLLVFPPSLPKWNPQKILSVLPSKCIHSLPAWSKPPRSLAWTTAAACFCLEVSPPHLGGGGGGLFNRKLHYVIPSPLVAPPLSKARSCTIQPCISSPPTRPPFTLLHTGPVTVSWDYQAHPHLRTFALTVSRFRNGLALNGRMAHFLYIFTYVDFSIKSSFPPAPKLRLMPTLRIPLFCVRFPPQHLSKMLCILSSLLSPPLILQAHEGCRFYLFSPLPSL